jgi:profilin
MSWNTYIDSVIGHAKGDCDSACLIGLEGGAKWTTDDYPTALKISDAEAATIANGIKADAVASFSGAGVTIGGQKYMYLRADPEEKLVLAKLKDNGALTIQAANTCIVIAHTAEGKSQGNTNKGVLAIIDYLKSVNM